MPADLSRLGRVAVVHDWLTGMRGGEQVLEAILETVPTAELFTLFHFPGSASEAIERRTIRTSFLQDLAADVSDYRTLLPLFPFAARSWDFRDFDLIVSSSHCVAKSVNSRGRPHLSYCHTPMRYVWDRFDDYLPPSRPIRRALATPVAAALRWWDARTAAGVTRFVANSAFVRERIERYYHRDAAVIHPFAGDEFFSRPLETDRGDYHLIVSALVPYKRIDLAIQAAAETGRPLVIIGSGPLAESLQQTAPDNVRFLGFVSAAELMGWMARARSVIVPGIEDFGITVVEALALGTPVVAFRGGGVLDTIEEGRTGILFDRFEVHSLAEALSRVEAHPWDRQELRSAAQHFTRSRFLNEFSEELARLTSNDDGGPPT